MYGKCKDCAKQMSCWNPFGVRFGFCETSFEPKEQLQEVQPERKHMVWKLLSSTICEAEGRDGTFRIERSRGWFWSRYSSADMSFKLPPKKKLAEAKAMCENNEYWEY